MKLSIVILNYNVRYFLELCLQSVIAATTTIDTEIIVVDNNSNDDSCAMVKAKYKSVICIENKTNLGFSKGNNIGVLKAKGEYICILNPDTVLDENTFKELLNFADKKPKVGIVGCKLIDGSGRFLPESKRNIPTPKVALKKIIGFSKAYYANHIEKNNVGKVTILPGAFMFIKREVYNKVGGFDETYFMYGEDIDLAYSIAQLGYENYYYGKTTVLHYKGESTLKNKEYAKRFYDAMQIFYKKHFKKNKLFDTFVYFSIQLAKQSKLKPKVLKQIPLCYYFVSDVKNHDIVKKVSKPIHIISEIKKIEPNSELIFDANYLSFKTIINSISELKNKKITFKIMPKNTNYSVGSNSSETKGEIIK